MGIINFLASWKSCRGKTYEFLETIPEDKITWKPHKDLGRNDPCWCGKKKPDGTPLKYKHCHYPN